MGAVSEYCWGRREAADGGAAAAVADGDEAADGEFADAPVDGAVEVAGEAGLEVADPDPVVPAVALPEAVAGAWEGVPVAGGSG